MFYCGLDVSLKQTALCVVDGDGLVVREAKLITEPEVISTYSLAGAPSRVNPSSVSVH